MPPALGAVAVAGASAYTANRAGKQRAPEMDPAKQFEVPRLSQYGSILRSYSTPNGGKYVKATFDPSIRALREQALGRLPDYRKGISDASGGLVSRLNQTRDELASNENPFIQARVNPLLARAAEGRGQLSRSLTRRGLGGSSLYSSGLGNYDAAVGREIGDQRALATAEALAARTGLDTQIFNSALSTLQAFQSMDAQEQQIASQNLMQELQALGMTEADIGAMLQASGINMQQAQLKNEAIGRGLDSVGRILGEVKWPSGLAL